MFQVVIDCFGISTSTVLVKTCSQVLASAATICEVSIGLFLALACLAIRVRDGRIRHASRRAEGKSHHGMDVCSQPQTRDVGRGGVRHPTSSSAGSNVGRYIGRDMRLSVCGLNTSHGKLIIYRGPSLSSSLAIYLLTRCGLREMYRR